MNNKLIICLALALIAHASVFGQYRNDLQKLTLEEVINMARSQSPYAKRAETTKENKYWQYRVFKSDYVPQLSLNGNLPNYQKSVTAVTQEDGTTAFRKVDQANTDLSLSLSQSIAATGAKLTVNSDIYRFDDFKNDNVQYGGNPVVIGLEQPIFAYNDLKWNRKIEPMRFEESKREFVQQLEVISRNSSRMFFDLLAAQISLKIAQQNVQSNDTIFKIAQGRYQLGKIPENDLLQLELNLMNSRQAVAQSELDYETSLLSLRSYLGNNTKEEFELMIPAFIPEFDLQEAKAMEQAKNNRMEYLAFQRRLLEAQKEVARAKGESGLNMNLFANYGLSNNGGTLSEVYQSPDEQIQARLGFYIPLLDWGRQKSRMKTALANYKLVEYTVAQEEVDFEREVYTKVKQFKMLKKKIEITKKADEISLKRYTISKNRYLIGKISITDLSIALTEKDQAKRDYINSLSDYWQAYYELRELTLYDFKNDVLLYTD